MKCNETQAAAGVRSGPELCRLAFLITGSWELSMEAVAGVLDIEGLDVQFSPRLKHSTRRRVAAASLAAIGPDLEVSGLRAARAAGGLAELMGPLGRLWASRPAPTRTELEHALLAIDAFPRCALLLTVLEGFSLEGAVLLLNAGEGLVRRGRDLGLLELARNLTR